MVPTHYAIELTPNLQALSIAGSETVDVDVREPVSRVVLNAVNSEISDASIDALIAHCAAIASTAHWDQRE